LTILKVLYAGIAASFSENSPPVVAIAIRDTTYLLDFFEDKVCNNQNHTSDDAVMDFIIAKLRDYSGEQLEKFLGVAMPVYLANRLPQLCSRLWKELDIVPLVSWEEESSHSDGLQPTAWETKSNDELAESMARRCIR
jgi:hypothetical protein